MTYLASSSLVISESLASILAASAASMRSLDCTLGSSFRNGRLLPSSSQRVNAPVISNI